MRVSFSAMLCSVLILTSPIAPRPQLHRHSRRRWRGGGRGDLWWHWRGEWPAPASAQWCPSFFEWHAERRGWYGGGRWGEWRYLWGAARYEHVVIPRTHTRNTNVHQLQLFSPFFYLLFCSKYRCVLIFCSCVIYVCRCLCQARLSVCWLKSCFLWPRPGLSAKKNPQKPVMLLKPARAASSECAVQLANVAKQHIAHNSIQ